MYFSYVNLPIVPEEFKEQCFENIKLIGVDPRLESLNAPRGEMNNGTFIPRHVIQWLIQNIAEPFLPGHVEDFKKSLFNVTHYTRTFNNPEWWGSHGRHIDVGRNYALNYYYDLGGDDTRIEWYTDDYNTRLAYKADVILNKWTLLKVDTIHAVRNILPNRNRVSISIPIIIEGIEGFDVNTYFEHITIKDTIIL